MNSHLDRCLILAQEIDNWHRYRGKKEWLRFLRGEHLTPLQAIWAGCYRCSSAYDAGKGCKVSDCPLTLFTPYREGKNSPRKRAKETLSDQRV